MKRLDFQRIIESVGDIVYLIDVNGEVLYLNPATFHVLGRRPDEMVGRILFEFMSPASAMMAEKNLRARLNGEEAPVRYYVDMLTNDGHLRKCELFTSMVEEDEKILWIQGTIRDQTESGQLREELTEERKMMGTLVDIMGTIVLATDIDGRITIFNKEAERKLGLVRGETTSKEFCEAIPDCKIPFPLSRDTLPFLQSISDEPSEIQIGNETRFISWSFSFVTDHNNELAGLIAVGSDMTEHIRMERMLKERTKILAMLNELGFLIASTLTVQTIFQEALINLMDFFGFEMGGAVRLDLERMRGRVIAVKGIPPWQRAEEFIEIPACLVEKIQNRDSNLIFIEIDKMECLEELIPSIQSGILILLSSSRGPVGAIMLFSSEVREIPEDRRTALEAASILLGSAYENIILYERLSNTLEQLKMFNDIMFHDMINYIVPVQGFLDLAKDNYEDPEKGHEFLMKAIASEKKLYHFIENVRTLIKVTQDDQVELMPVSLEKVLEDSIETVLGRHNGVNMVIDPRLKESMDGVRVRADGALTHLFMNVISNAIKFSSPETVTVNGGPNATNHSFIINVIDRGDGIPDELKEAIFERQYSGGSDRAKKSSGIGLTIVSSLINRYHGSIRVEDRVPGQHSKGAKFVIELPMA